MTSRIAALSVVGVVEDMEQNLQLQTSFEVGSCRAVLTLKSLLETFHALVYGRAQLELSSQLRIPLCAAIMHVGGAL